ncbi:hypothetical protein JCM17380_14640 [Desulfosporosinus burensis]
MDRPQRIEDWRTDGDPDKGKRLTRFFSLIKSKNHEQSKAMEVFTEQLFTHELLTYPNKLGHKGIEA